VIHGRPNYSEVCWHGEVAGRHWETLPAPHTDERGPSCICGGCTRSLLSRTATEMSEKNNNLNVKGKGLHQPRTSYQSPRTINRGCLQENLTEKILWKSSNLYQIV